MLITLSPSNNDDEFVEPTASIDTRYQCVEIVDPVALVIRDGSRGKIIVTKTENGVLEVTYKKVHPRGEDQVLEFRNGEIVRVTRV